MEVVVVKVVLACLHLGKIPQELNEIFLVLIPKKEKPVKVTDFRPISLRNVIYKIIAKFIANRLKLILPKVISENQCAFILGRLTTNNVFVVFEVVHSIRKRMRGKDGIMSLKLDMSNAFDKVEWCFFEKVMLKLGFDAKWMDVVLSCINSVSYKFLLNGTPTSFFNASK